MGREVRIKQIKSVSKSKAGPFKSVLRQMRRGSYAGWVVSREEKRLELEHFSVWRLGRFLRLWELRGWYKAMGVS